MPSVERLVQQQRRCRRPSGAAGRRTTAAPRRSRRPSTRAAVVDLGEDLVLQLERALDLLAQDLLVEQVLDADAEAVHLVGVRRADAAAGGADLAAAEEALGDLVDRAVVVGDDVRVGADDAGADVSMPRASRPSISSNSTSRSTTTPLPMTGTQPGVRMPLGSRCRAYFSVADDDRVAGVVAAVELHDVVDAGCRAGRWPCPCPRRPTGLRRSRLRAWDAPPSRHATSPW